MGTVPVEEDLLQSQEMFGLAMHGTAKYGPNSPHFDYANPDAPKGGTLRQAAIGTFDTLNPFSIKGKAAEGLPMIYDRLMARAWDEPFSLYPLIAEKIEVNAGRSGITFHLNPKAVFQDGTPITAEDVIFSFNLLKEKGRPNMRNVYAQVDKVEPLSGRVVKFTFKPSYDQETIMIIAMMPVLSKAWWKDRDFEKTLLEMPVTSGPYKITEIKPGSRIVLTRDPDYWAKDLMVNKGQYNFDQITYDYFRDDNVALEAFLKGSFDIRKEFDIGKWMTAYDKAAPTIEKHDFKNGRPAQVRAMIFNLRRPPFDDKNVRHALSLAFDEKWVGENVYRGQYKRAASYFPNSDLNGGLVSVTTGMGERERIAEATRLLQRAGWVVKNNKLQKDGKEFSFEIILSKPEDEKIVLAYISTLKRLGINARVRTLDSAGFQNRLNGFDYDMILHQWQNSLSPGTEQQLYWGCDINKNPNRLNYPGICNPLIKRVINFLPKVTTYDDLLRQVMVLDRLLIESFLSIPLFYSDVDRIAVNKNVQFPENTPIYGPVIETWWSAGATDSAKGPSN